MRNFLYKFLVSANFLDKIVYAGLCMVESKCVELDNEYTTAASAAMATAASTVASTEASAAKGEAVPRLSNSQWQALIALHRTLLNEHHDFFLASQHPSASPALRALAAKYAMPARMWRYGIHSFLELLRIHLPASLEHMTAFIYLAYSMMALLYETVKAFQDTWIECLGDLGRYRMAIEDDDLRDREIWTDVARYWYMKASDGAPSTGRLYHHLAILALPDLQRQLFFYLKSLCVANPFNSTHESILTLFQPVLNSTQHKRHYRKMPLDRTFIKLHGLLFTMQDIETQFDVTADHFFSLLDLHISQVTSGFMEQGTYIAISNCVALLGYASKNNKLMAIINPPPKSEDVEMAGTLTEELTPTREQTVQLFNKSLKIVLQRLGDPNVLPFLQIHLVFMHHLSHFPEAIASLRESFPWDSLATMLNALVEQLESSKSNSPDQELFPESEKDEKPLPEDYSLRGLVWTSHYFPTLFEWFNATNLKDEGRSRELPSMTIRRRILICRRIITEGNL